MATLITGSGVDKVIDGSIVDADIVGVSSSKLTGALPAVDGSALTNMAAGGKVLQVVQGVNSAVSSGTHTLHTSAASTWTEVVSKTINISSSSSKILVQFDCGLGGTGGSTSVHVVRGTTEIGMGDSSGSRNRSFTSSDGMGRNDYDIRTLSGNYLDSPATTGNVTYYIKTTSYTANTYYINRSVNHRDNAAGYDGVTASHIILTEIA